MYVRFTPKQLNVLKKLLPTVKLNAYDIQIYQEIQLTLENPIDEFPKKSKPTPRKQFVPPKTEKIKKEEPKHVENDDNKRNYIDSIVNSKIEENETNDSMFNELNDLEEKIKTSNNQLEELEDLEKDSESIFDVIDSRTKK